MTRNDGEPLWHLTQDFLEQDAVDSFRSIVAADEKNRTRSVEELQDALCVLDDCFMFAIALIQGWYRVQKTWEGRPEVRASMAMSVAAFNTLLLARHAILLGYYSESAGLLRNAHERTTRGSTPVTLTVWLGDRLLDSSTGSLAT